ncbi:hypothetical protein WJX81_000911 [Elliptochloris bilobata]|uniref:Nudix hydrolase domain-containing protein n=1 Tax=Elliptochloris bilobata TaxID=381761 RepID=A0AAW1SHL8_9CHLO
MSILHFETDQYQRNTTFLETAEYGRALDTFVKGCVDIVLENECGEVFLLKRRVHPQPDWWFLGGRMRARPLLQSHTAPAGDTPVDTAVAIVRRETQVQLPATRFRFVCAASYLWQFRQQEPQGNGTADVALVYSARVSAAEQSTAERNFDPAEYEAARWVQRSDAAKDTSLHPAVRSALAHMELREAEEHMRESAANDAALLQAGLPEEEFVPNFDTAPEFDMEEGWIPPFMNTRPVPPEDFKPRRRGADGEDDASDSSKSSLYEPAGAHSRRRRCKSVEAPKTRTQPSAGTKKSNSKTAANQTDNSRPAASREPKSPKQPRCDEGPGAGGMNTGAKAVPPPAARRSWLGWGCSAVKDAVAIGALAAEVAVLGGVALPALVVIEVAATIAITAVERNLLMLRSLVGV